ncbi:MAG TPA: NTP transferase domain-containing protein, partial [Gemmatimonadaceae bacterium]|nr:NTP transferase domain-containing protein [Gemmatimonadaceae bacterium]
MVVGHEAARVRAAVADLSVEIVENRDWPSGVGSSVAFGVSELTRHSCDARAVALLVSDQPFVTRDHLEALAAAVREGAPLAASMYAGTEGVPAVFGPSIVPELRELRGDTGAKDVVRRYLSSAALLPFAEAEYDVDTPSDLTRLR